MFALPEWPLALLLRGVPDAAHGEFLARLLNHLLRGQCIAQRLSELNGKRICLAVIDTDNTLHFCVEQGRLRRGRAGRPDDRGWDVRISGTLHDFLLLASRREDPDTLFFNRRLNIEGDTGTGLHVKNLLDALEYDVRAHLVEVLGADLGGLMHKLLEPGSKCGSGVQARRRASEERSVCV